MRKIPLTQVNGNSGPDPAKALDEIKRLYFKTTKATIDRDFDRAIDLLKSLPEIADRQRAHVYMEGLAEMRREWRRKKKMVKRAR